MERELITVKQLAEELGLPIQAVRSGLYLGREKGRVRLVRPGAPFAESLWDAETAREYIKSRPGQRGPRGRVVMVTDQGVKHGRTVYTIARSGWGPAAEVDEGDSVGDGRWGTIHQRGAHRAIIWGVFDRAPGVAKDPSYYEELARRRREG